MDCDLKRPIGDEFESSPKKILKSEDRYGSTGTPITLCANYFKVNKQPEFALTQYRVDFEPSIDVTQTRKTLINQNKVQLGSRFIFDGSSLYLTQNFDILPIETTFNGRPMKITIKKTGTIDSSDPAAFHLFNLIFREAMACLKLQNVRRDYYDPGAKIDVPMANLELWPGYLTSIRAHENEVLLCAEICHKFMRKETILNIAYRLMRENKFEWPEQLKKEVVGTTVLTEYTNKTYQIDDIDFTMTPSSKFEPAYKEGEISYSEYYETRYNIKIKDKFQFMLISQANERAKRAGKTDLIYLVPELCRATGMTDKMRSDYKLMQALSAFTRLVPETRVKALQKFNSRVQSTPESVAVLKEWKMELDSDLIKVPGRELPPETIVFGNDEQATASVKGEWVIRNGTSMYKSVPITRWLAIYPESIKDDTEKFLMEMKKASAEMSCEMKDPMKITLTDDRQDSYVIKIRELAEKKPNLILVVLPSNRADRYSAVKKMCLIDLGIPIQVVIRRTMIHKNVGSIATKVVIQMNAKLGGMPWSIKLPLSGLMTVGFDVSHHPRDKSRSIGAMVATMDLKKTGAFYSVTSSYKDGNEMNNGLSAHMKKALEIYRETCGALPEKIVFYRDGVGEGQIQYIQKLEIEPLMVKLRRIYDEQEPKLAYIIVNKRTNTRVFKPSGSMFINPKPGTVVDRVITLAERNDFFLISQHVSQGTVSPTAYNVIYNTSGLKKDKLESLTYKFTHLYYNWSGTTRIPAVCQYAKKLAFITSQSLQSSVHKNLERSLYFL